MKVTIDQKTNTQTFKRDNWKEYFRIYFRRQFIYFSNDKQFKWYRAVENNLDKPYIIYWILPLAPFMMVVVFLKWKWFSLAKWFWKKGWLKVKEGEKIPLLWFLNLFKGIKRVQIYSIIKETAGGFHSWCRSDKGILRKPNSALPKNLLEAYLKRSAVGENKLMEQPKIYAKK